MDNDTIKRRLIEAGDQLELIGEYKDYYSKVRFKCKKCKKHVEMLVSNAIKGIGCRYCAAEAIRNRCVKSVELFIAQAHKEHGNKYDYSKVVYKTARIKIKIICPLHGEFLQTPDNHLHGNRGKGNGCPKCGNILSFKQYLDVPTYLYYVKLTTYTGTYYKIGITSRGIEERFSQDKNIKITIICLFRFNTGKLAFIYEQLVLTLASNYVYRGESNILHNGGGDSEVFIFDIIEYVTKISNIFCSLKTLEVHNSSDKEHAKICKEEMNE